MIYNSLREQLETMLRSTPAVTSRLQAGIYGVLPCEDAGGTWIEPASGIPGVFATINILPEGNLGLFNRLATWEIRIYDDEGYRYKRLEQLVPIIEQLMTRREGLALDDDVLRTYRITQLADYIRDWDDDYHKHVIILRYNAQGT